MGERNGRAGQAELRPVSVATAPPRYFRKRYVTAGDRKWVVLPPGRKEARCRTTKTSESGAGGGPGAGIKAQGLGLGASCDVCLPLSRSFDGDDFDDVEEDEGLDDLENVEEVGALQGPAGWPAVALAVDL